MRAWIVLALVALGGCLQGNDDGGGAEETGDPVADDTDSDADQNVTVSRWSQDFELEFTMAVAGEVPQSGSNCVGGAVVGLSSMWANVSWSPDIELRFLIATEGGSRVVADETGASPLSLQGTSTTGDQHVTVALLAPAGGSAPSVEAQLDVEGVAAQEPTFGEVQCAF